MEGSQCPAPKRARILATRCRVGAGAAPASYPEQVFLKNLQIEGFKTFERRQSIDICAGWQPRNERAWASGGSGPPAPSPLSIIFGGNGAGKSAIFDAVFFVLGQSAKSMRSSAGSAQLVNDHVVRRKGPNASASVTITFQKSGGRQEDKERSADGDVSQSPLGSGIIQELSVGRSIKHIKGTSTYRVQGRVCSRTTMMQELNDFVGADMGQVDRYVLKQGSTMMCRREGKELLSFIERLAGTEKLKAEAEEVQASLDDKREEVLNLEADVQASAYARTGLQPQVEAFLSHQREVAALRQEKTGLWQRQLASLRVRLDELETGVTKNEAEATELRVKIKSKESKHECAEGDFRRATQASEDALKTQSSARGKVQKAKSAQAETEALAKKSLKSARAKDKALARARKLLEEGDAEIDKVSARACELDAASESMVARIHELESSRLSSLTGGNATERDELVRELTRLEQGPLQELEKSVAERKQMIVKAGAVLDKLVANAKVVRLEMKTSNKAVENTRNELKTLQEKVDEIDAESAKLREHCTTQQALASSLEARRTAQEATANTAKRMSRGSVPSACVTEGRTCSSRGQLPVPSPGGRATALRSLIERLRDGDGVGGQVGVHGMLADLVLLRRQGDEAAVSAVLGSSLRNTVVVQTRRDGARLVAEVRAAGIPGQVRCDVLDEISGGAVMTAVAAAGTKQQGAGSSRLRPLSACVTTSDPRHFPAVEKHLQGWLLAETRQAAWSVNHAAAHPTTAINVVTISGELFFASGEVAVKAPGTPIHTPRLKVAKNGEQQRERQQDRGSAPSAQQEQAHESEHDMELRLEGALESLSTAETRLAELASSSAQARFECEDAHTRHDKARTKAEEYEREMVKINDKVSAQRRLISSNDEDGMKKGPAADDTDEVQLKNLLEQRDKIVAELARGDTSGSGETNRFDLSARDAAFQEVRNLRTEVIAGCELRDEVRVKLRVLTKRGTTRRDRVKALEAEKKDLEVQQKSIKARQLLHERQVPALLAELEETKSVYQAKRAAARQEEGAARNAKRELSAIVAARAELSKKQELLQKDHRKARADASRLIRSLALAARTAADVAGSSPPNAPLDESEEGSEIVDTEDAAAAAAAAARLSRTFDIFLRNNTVDNVRKEKADLEPSDSEGDDGDDGSNVSGGEDVSGDDCNRNSNKQQSSSNKQLRGRRGKAFRARESEDTRDGKGSASATDVGRRKSRFSEKRCALAVRATVVEAAASYVCADEKDEASVCAFVRVLKASAGGGGRGGVGGGRTDFLKETAEAEASIRLKDAKLKIGGDKIDVAAIAEAVRLDRESVDVGHKLYVTRESVLALMEKNEMLQATRHAALVKCLEEVNDALGSIYGQLTSIETPMYPGSYGKALGNCGIRGAPGGDCFLRFSQERSLLLSEGLSVQVKPEPGSPWRSPGSLSGGQVALVGLALNLATQAVRPAPLYLMDEIDSALDTHKVQRVASLLAARARSGSEQCIVVSHRPEMQERGSHLIGVYHCEGTARTVGLELLSQLPSNGQQTDEYS
ncbi:unnamed protein product [Scytosiphon promiscuus]